MANRIHISTRKGLFTARKLAGGWKIDDAIAFRGAPVTLTLHDARSGHDFAALNHGHFGQKLHRSKDAGAKWEEIAVPVYPAKPEGVTDMCPMRKVPVPWSLQLIWSLETGAADGQIWCGTIPGGLFVSHDHGDSWSLNEPLWNLPQRAKWFGGGYDWPGIHSILVDPRDRRSFTVGVSCGGAWLTNDDGATWENRAHGMIAAYMPPGVANDPDIQDAHRIARCAASPDVLWTQHHSGVFRTDNNGIEWSEIKHAAPSNFGFAVAAHPQNPDVAWFAPGTSDEIRLPVDGRFVVSRTSDAGKTFDVISSGLPDAQASHLVYRHGLEVDSTGNLLAMGSTTGSFWLSENGGDHWTRLSAELPPIYAVRIVE
ncbi:exo-alpha-sialidase [soil metagenome]